MSLQLIEHVSLTLKPPRNGWLPMRLQLNDFVIEDSVSNVLNDPLGELIGASFLVKGGKVRLIPVLTVLIPVLLAGALPSTAEPSPAAVTEVTPPTATLAQSAEAPVEPCSGMDCLNGNLPHMYEPRWLSVMMTLGAAAALWFGIWGCYRLFHRPGGKFQNFFITFWTLGPPLYFLFSYHVMFRYFVPDGPAADHYWSSQRLYTALWAGIAALTVAILSGRVSKAPPESQTSSASVPEQIKEKA